MSHTEIKAELYFASSYSMDIRSRDQRAKQNSIQVEQRGEVWRHITMVANFRITCTTMESFCYGDGEQQKKPVGLDWQKTQLCKCITLFCTFQSRCCTTATWNFGVARWAQHKNFLFLNSPTFDKLNEIKLDRWSFKQCESPFKWCFGLLSSTNFAAMATWRNDFSSLLKNGQGHVLFRSLLRRRSAK